MHTGRALNAPLPIQSHWPPRDDQSIVGDQAHRTRLRRTADREVQPDSLRRGRVAVRDETAVEDSTAAAAGAAAHTNSRPDSLQNW